MVMLNKLLEFALQSRCTSNVLVCHFIIIFLWIQCCAELKENIFFCPSNMITVPWKKVTSDADYRLLGSGCRGSRFGSCMEPLYSLLCLSHTRDLLQACPSSAFMPMTSWAAKPAMRLELDAVEQTVPCCLSPEFWWNGYKYVLLSISAKFIKKCILAMDQPKGLFHHGTFSVTLSSAIFLCLSKPVFPLNSIRPKMATL